MSTPPITYIIASRNDNYCGNSVGRLRNTLDRLILLRGGYAGVDPSPCEIIVSDWGSRKPLHDELWAYARNDVRFLYIPESITRTFETPFEECHALNLAARKAKADWIGRLDQDTLVGERFVRWFGQGPERACYFSGRRDLGEYETTSLATPVNPTSFGQTFYRAAVGILLAPKQTWHDCRGYDEMMIHRLHTEHDFVYRMGNLGMVLDLGKMLDYPFWHQHHDRAGGDARKHNQAKSDQEIAESLGSAAYVNDSGWGLLHFDSLIQDSNP